MQNEPPNPYVGLPDGEKRDQPRINVQGVSLWSRRDLYYLGDVIDMTPYGIQIKAAENIPLGPYKQAELKFEQPVDGFTSLEVDLLVIWSEEIEGHRLIGCKLMINPNEVAFLEKLTEIFSTQ